MALPRIEVEVSADTQAATQNLDKFNNELGQTATKASGVNAPLNRATRQTQAYGRAAQRSSAHTTNLMFQFQDIGMMLAAGQSPLMLAMQQGTQVSGVFQQMKNSGQSAFQGIIGGLGAMVSPLSIMTLGVIAGGAALVQWGVSALNASDEADRLSERMGELEKNSLALNEELRRMRLGVSADELTLMDAIAEKQREVKTILDEVKKGHGRNRRAAELRLDTAQDELSTLQSQLETLRQQQAQKERLVRSTRELSDAERALWQTSKDVSREAERLVEQLGFAAIKALVLADVDITSPISSATKEAAQLAANMGIALDAALKLQDAGVSQGNRPRMRPMDLGDRPGEGVRPRMRPMDLGAPSVRGSGGGLSDAEIAERERANRIESLVQSLKTEREVIEEWRAEGVELLNQANQAELEALGGHNEAKLRLEKEYQERLKTLKENERNTQLAIMGDLFASGAQLMQSGNKKLFEIGKGFAIANATIAGIEAAQHAWNKGMAAGGPPLAAAFTALSLANTGARIAALKSASASGGGARGGGVGAGGGQATVSTQRVDLNIIGGNDRDRVVAREVINALNSAQRDGFRLDPRLIGT